MGIFKDKKPKGNKSISASAPEGEETKEEVEYVKELSEPTPGEKEQTVNPVESVAEQPKSEVREIPVCMSQTQINNMIIDNNMMLKYIVSEIAKE